MKLQLRQVSVLGFLTGAVTAVTVSLSGPAAAAPVGQVLAAGADVIPNSYVVTLKAGSGDVPTTAAGLGRRYGAKVTRMYSSALRGFAATLSADGASRLAADPAVESVEEDALMHVSAAEANPPSWGLDRIDQRALPLDSSYTYPNTAARVHAYIIDTGIRFSHSDFGGRAVSGRDLVDNDDDATDCAGHGTHVAGTVGGSAYGVAKQVTLVGVRVLDCKGAAPASIVIAGVDWVTANAVKPAVANMSLGGGPSKGLDAAVRNSIASGITYSIAAGNATNGKDACGVSPADVSEAITVGATDTTDARAYFSDYGPCLDLFAPGRGITSAWFTSDTATNTISGTSMAAPHVAGAAALILAQNGGLNPAQVADVIVERATPNVVTDPKPGSPNRLLYVGR